VIRTSYLTTLLLVAYRRLKRERRHDWIRRCADIVTTDGLRQDQIYHAVLFPSYKEGLDILTPSIMALERTNYPKEKMIVILSVEERAGDETWQNALHLQEVHGKNFFHFIATRESPERIYR
jgi:hypothetical protein